MNKMSEFGFNYRVSKVDDVELEQEPSVGGDGLIHLTVRDELIVLCQQELLSLKAALDDFLKGAPAE